MQKKRKTNLFARVVPFPLFRRLHPPPNPVSPPIISSSLVIPFHPVSLHSRPRFRHLVTLLPFVYPCPSLGNVRSWEISVLDFVSGSLVWSVSVLLRIACFASAVLVSCFVSALLALSLVSVLLAARFLFVLLLVCFVCCDSTCRLLRLFCFTFRFSGLFCSAAGSRLLSLLRLLCLFSRPTGFRFFSSFRLLCLSPCRLLCFFLLF